MKRSSIILIVALFVIIVAPLIYVGTVVSTSKETFDIKNWIVENISTKAEAEHVYKMYISSPCSDSIPECYMNVTTYSGKVDTLHPANFIDPVAGVQAVMRGDSIIVVLDNLNLFVGDGLFLTVELPKNVRLFIDNSVPTAHIHTHNVVLSALNYNSRSSLMAVNSQIGALISIDTLTPKTLQMFNSNIGAMQLNGDKASLDISNSNIGAIVVSGTCESIAFDNSNIGVCSWNQACAEKAVIRDCKISTTVDEGIVAITIDDYNDAKKRTWSNGSVNIEVEDDGDKVSITPTQVNVEGEDGETVDITPGGVHVVTDDTEVHITPNGIKVSEEGEDVVSIGMGGVKIKQ